MVVVLIALKSPLLSQVTAFQLIAVKRLAGENIPYGRTFGFWCVVCSAATDHIYKRLIICVIKCLLGI